MKMFARFLAIAVAFAFSTAALSAQQPTSFSTTARREVITQVRVTNHNWLDLKIYLDNNGVLVPLGFVIAQQTALIPIPERALTTTNPLRIVAMPLGSTSAYVSPEMILVRGDKVLLTLENRLGLSSTSMRATVD
jgi:hypothetical protein